MILVLTNACTSFQASYTACSLSELSDVLPAKEYPHAYTYAIASMAVPVVFAMLTA
jgi:hypothetical protein